MLNHGPRYSQKLCQDVSHLACLGLFFSVGFNGLIVMSIFSFWQQLLGNYLLHDNTPISTEESTICQPLPHSKLLLLHGLTQVGLQKHKLAQAKLCASQTKDSGYLGRVLVLTDTSSTWSWLHHTTSNATA